MNKKVLRNTCFIFSFWLVSTNAISQKNPVVDGWYADPEGVIFDKQYWIYPTYSARYEKQVFLDAFSSSDMQLLKTKTFDSGAVALYYEPVKK